MLLFAAAFSAGAQTLQDAVTFGENNYYGTARSIALGNAMTALGGDLGSIGINPAGSAVSPYSQFTISTGLTISSNTSAYSANIDAPYTNQTVDSRTRMTMPNIGVNLVYDTFRDRGLKSVSFGFLANTTNKFLSKYDVLGENSESSMFQSFAYGATGYDPDALTSFDSYQAPWDYVAAYQSGLISAVNDGVGTNYVGVTEQVSRNADGSYDFYVPGTLRQNSLRQVGGSKSDMIMNFGMNFSDRFYLGFNIGMPLGDYKYDEYYSERPVSTEDFTFNYDDGSSVSLSKAQYQYSYTGSISGIYAKAGFIWLPFDGLRIGGAIQSPAITTIEERWQVAGNTSFTDNFFDASAVSPINEYAYNLTSPYRANGGVAYTFGSFGLVSVDYEMADYRSMRYSSLDSNLMSDDFSDVNRAIKDNAAIQRSLRAGAEFKVNPATALRVGYSLTTSPLAAVKANTTAYSGGLGYSS